MIVPLRYVFAVCVFALFFKHNPWRSEKEKRKQGVVDKYFESIPPDIPEIDSDDERDSNDDADTDGNNQSEDESFIEKMKRIRRGGCDGRKNMSSDDTEA